LSFKRRVGGFFKQGEGVVGKSMRNAEEKREKKLVCLKEILTPVNHQKDRVAGRASAQEINR